MRAIEDVVAPFVSSATAPVFALRGVPEEVVATLMAYYSRSPVGLRANLAEMIDEGFVPPPSSGITAAAQEKARAFHAKWTVGYGHGSVAEHAVLHIGIEAVSLLAAKAVEDCRLGTAFTEKSTRYVPFSEDSVLSAELAGVDSQGAPRFDDAARGLMRAYLRAVDAYLEIAPDGTPTARRGWALDRARQLLPVGTKTSLGLTVNGRALRAMVRKLRADLHPEVQALAESLAAVGASELPGLLGECPPATPERVRDNYAEFAAARRSGVVESPDVRLRVETIPRGLPVASFPLGREFERVGVDLDIQCSYAAWRDVQRHRVFSADRVVVQHGSAVELIDAGALPETVQRELLDAILAAHEAASALTASGHPHLAEYLAPIGTLVRVRMRGNLRGLAHFIALRSGIQGHDSYRTIAQSAHRQLARVAPDIASAIPCNYEARDCARK